MRRRCAQYARVGRRGFSLIELMVVLAVLSITAAIAFAAIRQDEFRGEHARFVADVEGAIVQARNHAIDRQTQVRVDVESTQVTVTAFDPVTDTWSLIERVGLDVGEDSLLADNQRVCIYGLTPGIPAPSQATMIDPPTDCLAAIHQIVFASDGSFTDPQQTFSATLDSAGVVMWIADRTLTANTKLAVIQVFPGGLIRKFMEVAT